VADLSPEAVTARLRRVSELSSLEMPQPSRVDMSPAAVTRRLREMSELLALQLKLGRVSLPEAPPVGDG
jgi:hypothetical protein